MLKKISLAFVISFIALNASALGGDYKGNPGYVMYCAAKTNQYEMTDLYELRAVQGLKIKFTEGSDFTEILENLFKRIARLNPTRANLYRSYLKTFSNESGMINNTDLKVLAVDDDWGAVENGCELKQAVVQFKTPNLIGRRYFIDADLWVKLDEHNKAALALHEFIYREGLLPGNDFKTSTGVRYLNGVFHSEIFETLPLQKYFDTLSNVGFQTADAHGYPVLLNTGANNPSPRLLPYSFYDSDHLYSATLQAEVLLPLMGKNKQLFHCNIVPGKEEQHQIFFHSTGIIQSVHFQCDRYAYFDLLSHTEGVGGQVYGDLFSYDEQGRLKSFSAEYNGRDLEQALIYSGPNFSFVRDLNEKSGGVVVSFKNSGEVESLCMAHDVKGYANSWYTANGQRASIPLSMGPMVGFDDQIAPTLEPESCD